MKENIIEKYHPELKTHNYEEVNNLAKIVRNEYGEIIDPLHKSLPFITKYEKSRIIGERAKQINAGAQPLIPVEPNMIDGYLIALKEFEEKQAKQLKAMDRAKTAEARKLANKLKQLTKKTRGKGKNKEI